MFTDIYNIQKVVVGLCHPTQPFPPLASGCHIPRAQHAGGHSMLQKADSSELKQYTFTWLRW